ncbi:MAG: WecB/TagA/CpsF family glycosyltransferase [Candidatus Magasanikbacteria bacterium]
MNYVKILDVRIDNVNKKQVLETVADFLQSDKQNKIFTPNPEMLVDARKDQYFKEILNSGDLNICDGKGLEIASRGQLKRIPGVDLMLDICELAEKENKSIYLLGSGSDEVVKKTAEVLQEKFPLLKIVGHSMGPSITTEQHNNRTTLVYNKDKNEDLMYDIITSAPDILFVAFGHGKQEKWIEENLIDLPSVKVAMGVGGSFDFISGKTKRAPVWMRKIGLEWLYRLVREPKRVGRIFKATFVFLSLSRKYTK